VVTQRLADAAARLLERRVDRRGLLARTAIVGSAVATSGLDYVLRPGSAYSSVCGSGASCHSGWTAMCCTINNGVNQCPPGSFAGGWWKADGAGLCGGKARYYVDCQGECTGCGCGGGAFCASHCWNCHSHCADGSCDKRIVCNNVFRYGQCNRDRSCSGPVLCRTITCSPPWHWADCSSASATDDNTRNHSASCLSGWTHIARRYTELGSQGSALGATVGHERTVEKAKVQHYQHGRMYWTEHTGAHYLTSALVTTYVGHGEVRSPLGLPTGDAHTVDGGHVVQLQHGEIVQQGSGHPRALWGSIYRGWKAAGKQTGELGFPQTGVLTEAKGEYALFEHGGIYDPPGSTPRHRLLAPIDTTYRRLGGVTGVLGWPTSAAEALPHGLGSRARFESGEVVDSGFGTFGISGAIDVAYQRLGGATGALGLPSAEAAAVGRLGSQQTFVSQSNGSGSISLLSGARSAFGVWGDIYETWQDNGGAAGSLGFPVTDVVTATDGDQTCTFQHGTISYDASTGTTTVTRG
jgi:uncharacterized protein with LGFP repeats